MRTILTGSEERSKVVMVLQVRPTQTRFATNILYTPQSSQLLRSDRFRCYYTTSSKIGSQLLLASSSSNVLHGRGSEKAFNECLGVSNVIPFVQIWLLVFFEILSKAIRIYICPL